VTNILLIHLFQVSLELIPDSLREGYRISCSICITRPLYLICLDKQKKDFAESRFQRKSAFTFPNLVVLALSST
jgi:hypothetical protein